MDHDLVAGLRAARARLLVGIDFDGTLAPIVDDPTTARPVEGAVAVLEELVTACAEVAVVSGRPLGFLEPLLPTGVTVVGLYGLESRRHGAHRTHPDADRWRRTVDDAAAEAARLLPDGTRVEHKGLSLTLHYRGREDLAAAVGEVAARLGPAGGLEVRAARMSVELHPPLATDKGSVLLDLAGAHSGPVLFAGDDLGDLPAFDALDELAAMGRTVLRVAVVGDETPPELAARADRTVDGPAGVVALLGGLVADGPADDPVGGPAD